MDAGGGVEPILVDLIQFNGGGGFSRWSDGGGGLFYNSFMLVANQLIGGKGLVALARWWCTGAYGSRELLAIHNG